MTLSRLSPAVAAYDTNSCAALVRGAQMNCLADDPGWWALLHYETHALRGPRNRAHTPAFFLSADGPSSPQDELRANIEAMCPALLGTPQSPSAQDLDASSSPPWCRFPARYRFFVEHLAILAPSQNNLASCKAYTRWRDELTPKRISLVFAAGDMRRPSTLFGHTFLTLDKGQDNTSELLAQSVSYTVAPSARHAPLFVAQAFLGTLDATYDVGPYYRAIQLYGDAQSRDMWTYRLDLSTAQIGRLVDHLWEVRDTTFDYAFLTANCAQALLSLLDIAAPGFFLAAQLGLFAIPMDAVHILGHTKRLYSDVQLRPSLATQTQEAFAGLSRYEVHEATRLADPSDKSALEALNSLSKVRQDAVLGAADLLMRQRYGANGLANTRAQSPPQARRTAEILAMRVQNKHDINFPAEAERQAAVREKAPHRGHKTTRVGVGAYATQAGVWGEASIRAALHDSLDNPQGYSPNAALEVMALRLRALEGDVQRGYAPVQLTLDVLRMTNLQPFSPWSKPLSWRGALQLGTHEKDAASSTTLDGRRLLAPLFACLELGLGASLAPPRRLPQIFYGFLDAAFETGARRVDGVHVEIGPAVGLLSRFGPRVSARVEAKLPFVLYGVDQQPLLSASACAAVHYAPSERFALRVSGHYCRARGAGRVLALFYF